MILQNVLENLLSILHYVIEQLSSFLSSSVNVLEDLHSIFHSVLENLFSFLSSSFILSLCIAFKGFILFLILSFSIVFKVCCSVPKMSSRLGKESEI